MTATNIETTDSIFDLTPEQFHQQEEAEHRAAQEARDAAEQAKREAAEAAERKKAEAKVSLISRWRNWLSQIGQHAGLPFEVRETGREYGNPCELIVRGINIPIHEGYGSSRSLEISLPWYTARYDSWRRRRESPEACKSRMKKDGSFNYAALGMMAKRYAEVEAKHRADEANKVQAAGTVKQLAADLSYSNIEPSADPEKPVRFKFSITRDMTPQGVHDAIAALRAAGLLAAPENKS